VTPEGWLKGLKEICERHNILLIDGEIQTGFRRTGRWFACEHWGVEPLIGVEIVKDKGMKRPGVEEADAICAAAFKRASTRLGRGPMGLRTSRWHPPRILIEAQADTALDILPESITEGEGD